MKTKVGEEQIGFFTAPTSEEVLKTAKKSKRANTAYTALKAKLMPVEQEVREYFKNSKAVCITDRASLHKYIDDMIQNGCGAIDCETTGLDRYNDSIIGVSLYTPNNAEVYIPLKHIMPETDKLYMLQLDYEDVKEELERAVKAKVKMIFANADFDLAMINNSIGVDLLPAFYYDCITAWRVIKEDEPQNGLKYLYNKYVLKGAGDPKKFEDFFPIELYKYSDPEIAKLYAANDARITYELYEWQLPLITKENEKCKLYHLEKIADLVWNLEFPMVKICQQMHRRGVYFDWEMNKRLENKYGKQLKEESEKLDKLITEAFNKPRKDKTVEIKYPRETFNCNSTQQLKWLLYEYMGLECPDKTVNVDKATLKILNTPLTNQILKVRNLNKLINTYIEKMPNVVREDGRVHCTFNSMGADTGRMASKDPNMQNIPQKAHDIRRMFRATPGCALISCDYSSQEPRMTAYVSRDKKMIEAFREGRDVYATIASIAFNLKYEECLEFNPETGEYQDDGYKRRSEAKTIVLGICYGRSVRSIGEQLYGKDSNMSDKQKLAKAQNIYDAVMKSFPGLERLQKQAKDNARRDGYLETVFGRRRHLNNINLPRYEFEPMKGYKYDKIPKADKERYYKELTGCKYWGQVAERTKELYKEHIRVVDNSPKIAAAERQCVNSIIQGSAADQTKLALLHINKNKRWNEIGGRLLLPVHDEIIAEVPLGHIDEATEILQEEMKGVAAFMPFPCKCDVAVMLRWNGLDFPCQYAQYYTEDVNTTNENEVKWIQYALVEMGYELPAIEKEGEMLQGDEEYGINGVVTEEYKEAIRDYEREHNITDKEFSMHIYENVLMGYTDYDGPEVIKEKQKQINSVK